jgi:hypothetical protein
MLKNKKYLYQLRRKSELMQNVKMSILRIMYIQSVHKHNRRKIKATIYEI